MHYANISQLIQTGVIVEHMKDLWSYDVGTPGWRDGRLSEKLCARRKVRTLECRACGGSGTDHEAPRFSARPQMWAKLPLQAAVQAAIKWSFRQPLPASTGAQAPFCTLLGIKYVNMGRHT